GVSVMPSNLADKLAAFDPTLPLAKAHTIPSLWYFDPEIHEAERRCVFGGSWQVAGRVDQVADPGSFFTIDLAGDPVLVLRDQQGVLRAFYNVCRHKAAQVINECEGTLTKLRCRYHGWTSGLAGAIDYSHYRTEIAGNTSVQISPLRRSDDPTVAQVRAGDSAYYWWIFPNLMVNVYDGVMDTNVVLPLGPERCKVIFDFYFA